VEKKRRVLSKNPNRGSRVIDVVVLFDGVVHLPRPGVAIYEWDLEFDLLEQTKCGKVGFLFKDKEVFDKYTRCLNCEN
jgi:hypothetical protein